MSLYYCFAAMCIAIILCKRAYGMNNPLHVYTIYMLYIVKCLPAN